MTDQIIPKYKIGDALYTREKGKMPCRFIIEKIEIFKDYKNEIFAGYSGRTYCKKEKKSFEYSAHEDYCFDNFDDAYTFWMIEAQRLFKEKNDDKCP